MPVTAPSRSRELLREFTNLAVRQQEALVRFERERFEMATQFMEVLVPALRDAGPELDPEALRQALHIVTTTLSLIQALQEARDRILQSLRALGASTGLSIDLEV
jgi:hypothetical protein